MLPSRRGRDIRLTLRERDESMKTGLVLEGGAMRGLYTAGALDVLMKQGIAVDGAVGVSAGAVFGCNMKSGQIGRVLRYNTAYCRDPRYMSLRSLLRTGDLYGEQFCYHDIPDRLDPFDREAFRASPMAFYVVCTDVRTGKPVYRRMTDGGPGDLQWMRASASMPMVSRVVQVDGYELLDGGIVDAIPIDWFRQQGYERNLVILTRPAGYRKQPVQALPLMRLLLRRYPAVAREMAVRQQRYNDTRARVEQLEARGVTLVLRPSRPLPIRRVEKDPHRLREAYAIGRADALARLEEIRRFLGNSEKR